MEQQPSPFTVRCETPAIQNGIDAIAAAMDRSRSWVVNQALKEFVAANAWQIKAIEEGLQSLEAGHSIPHDSLMQRMEAKLRDPS